MTYGKLYEVRLALEPLAVHHAAETFTDEQAARARRLLETHVKASQGRDLRRIWSTHTDLHFALYGAAESRWLVRLIKPLWQMSERYRFAVLRLRIGLPDRRIEHERILEACIRHEPTVAAIELRDHLARTANIIANEMGSAELFDLVEVPNGPDHGRHGIDPGSPPQIKRQ
jgi:DNA-binding GntR family transcriptional regulator